jgi:group I intron endonuclease
MIYLITNTVNFKGYVGKLDNPNKTVEERFYEHCTSNKCPAIHAAIKKYGKDNFKREVIEEHAGIHGNNFLEKWWIARLGTYTSGYNLSEGGETSPMTNPATRAKVSKTLTGRKCPERQGVPNEGARAYMLAHNPMKNPDTAAKCANSNRGKPRPHMLGDRNPIHRITNPMKNPLTAAKVSNAMSGRTNTPEHNAAISAAKRGTTLSLEHKAKISASLKGNQRARRKALNDPTH